MVVVVIPKQGALARINNKPQGGSIDPTQCSVYLFQHEKTNLVRLRSSKGTFWPNPPALAKLCLLHTPTSARVNGSKHMFKPSVRLFQLHAFISLYANIEIPEQSLGEMFSPPCQSSSVAFYEEEQVCQCKCVSRGWCKQICLGIVCDSIPKHPAFHFMRVTSVQVQRCSERAAIAVEPSWWWGGRQQIVLLFFLIFSQLTNKYIRSK